MTAPAAPQEGPPACVVAVVVTYQPEVSALLAQIQALRPQVARMVVVDNASTADVAGWCRAQAPQVGGGRGDAPCRTRRKLSFHDVAAVPAFTRAVPCRAAAVR